VPVFRRARRTPVPEVERRIRAVLDDLQPMFRVESFTVELLRFDSDSRTAHLRVAGGCPDCEMTPAALARGIEAALRRNVPEVEAVEADSTVD
jgi:Fe-S cluster biogenesis protein NfuA